MATNTQLYAYTAVIRDLFASAAVQTWAAATLGREWKVLVGVDKRNPPGIKDCPFVMLRPSTIESSPVADDQDPAIMIDWGIADPGTPTTTGRVTEYTSIDLLDQMAMKIRTLLMEAGVPLARAVVELETEAFFPLMLGGMDITLSLPNTIGTIGG